MHSCTHSSKVPPPPPFPYDRSVDSRQAQPARPCAS
jgi:hypothetical protein